MATLGNITFACKDPAKLASFWASACNDNCLNLWLS